MASTFSEETLHAVGELLALGEQRGFAVLFRPQPDGWRIDYVRRFNGGALVSGPELGETARSAIGPLLEIAQEYEDAAAARRH